MLLPENVNFHIRRCDAKQSPGWPKVIYVQIEGLFLVIVVKLIARLRMELTTPIYRHYVRYVYSVGSYKERLLQVLVWG